MGGRSPINEQCRALIGALRAELDSHGVKLPIYWGNRNWHPFLEETMRRMAGDGVRRALVEPLIGRVRDARAQISEDRRGAARLLATAHSIPLEMAQTSKYVEQLTEVARRGGGGGGGAGGRPG